MLFSLKTSCLYLAILLGALVLSILCDLPGDDMPNQTTSSCSTDADCQTYYHARCSGGTCTGCNSDSQCDRFYSPGDCSSSRCAIPCSSSNQEICWQKRTICSSNKCTQCFSDGDCNGYPGSNIYCLMHSTEINLCVNCKTDSHCPSGMVCQNYKCKECSSDSQCPTAKPYCLKTFTQNVCKQCLQNSHCPTATSPKCSSSNSCTGCSGPGDCTHISGKPVCSGGTCVECAADSDCTNPTMSKCNTGTKTCGPCSGHPNCVHLTPLTYCLSGTCINAECTTVGECTAVVKSHCNTGTKFCEICTAGSGQCSHLSATPLCAGSPLGCVQCIASTDCTTEAYSVCNAAGSCQRCSIDSNCNNFSLKPICDTSVGCVECKVSTTCTNVLKSRCSSNTCQLCSTSTDCSHLTPTPVCSNTAAGCVECKFDTTCTNLLKSHCNSGFTCELCSSNSHCSHFSTTKVCSYIATLGCVQCMTNSDCQDPTKSFCDTSTHTCKLCSGNPECSHLSLTPYCSSTKCTECLTNSHCTAIAKSYCNPSYVCQVCSINDQCTHLTAIPYCSPSDSRCAQCTSHSHCTNPAKSNCVSASKTCQLCTGDPQCSHLPATPRCSGTSFGCVECLSNAECPTTAKSYCYPSLHICQSCFSDGHCAHLPNVNKCWYGECVMYSPVCTPTYTVEITQEKSLNDFLVEFDADLVTKINILSTIKIRFIDVEKTDYTYTVTKVTDTLFKVNFQVKKTIPKTQIEVEVPCPTQPGHVYGNITEEANTKKIPFASDELKAQMETLGDMATTATTAVSGISGAMMFMGANPAILWALIGAIQTFYYMLFINVQYPANVKAFFPIFALGNLDFIPNPMWIIFPNIDEFSLPVPTKFAEHEVDGLFLANAGNMLLLWLGNIALYSFSFIVMRYTRNMPKILAMGCSKVVTTFEWSGIFRIFITSYMELTIAAFLQLRVLEFDSGLFSASSVCGVIFGTFGVLLPVATYKIVQRYDTNPKLIKLKFGTLIEEYKLNDDIQKYFTVISIGRNLILAASLVYLHNYPYIEIITLTSLSFSFAYLLYKYKPHNNRISNVSNFISELVFGVVHIFIFILIHDDYSPSFSDEERLNIGWGIIAGCGLILMSTMIVAIAEQITVVRTMIGLLGKVLKGERKSREKNLKKLSQNIKKVNRQAMQVTDESLILNKSHDMSFPTLGMSSELESLEQIAIKRPINLTEKRRRKIKRPGK